MNSNIKYLYFPDVCSKCNKLNPENILVDRGYGYAKYNSLLYNNDDIYIVGGESIANNTGGNNSEMFMYRNNKLFYY
jgi:hypothetical protein